MIASAPVVPAGSRSPEAIAIEELRAKFGEAAITPQETQDDVPTFWVPRDKVREVLRFLKSGIDRPYKLLYDITAIDERARTHREGQPASDFTIVYHLLSFDRNADIRIKVGLPEASASVPTITDVWKNADWYERETFDMFGVKFDGHPNLRRLLMPDSWKGHPLRKEHPARATEMGPFTMSDEKAEAEMDALLFRPEDWGMSRKSGDTEFMFLNIGPQHPGTHGVLRIVLQLDGEEIVDAVAEIGYHHRGAEKMAERQSWHTYIPYTDRIDYLGGVMNNLPYLLALERLAGITIPDRAKVIRIMMCELFRICSHLVWYGTFAQDIGAMSPVFYLFNDRERAFDIVSAVTGGRMHPNWFRIGGTAQDLPDGWYKMFDEFTKYLVERLAAYDEAIIKNQIFIARTKGVGAYTLDEAIEWGITGAGLRANGFEWDFRKMRPYAGYDQFEFDIPTTTGGDSLRASDHPHRRDAPVRAHHPPVHGQHARRSVQVGPSADHAAAQAAHHARHRDAHQSLPWRVLGTGDAGRRRLPDDRSDEGREQLLRYLRRRNSLVPYANPHAVVRAHPAASRDLAGAHDSRSLGGDREHRFRSRRHRSVGDFLRC